MAQLVSETKQTERHDVVDLLVTTTTKANEDLAPGITEAAQPWFKARKALDAIRDDATLTPLGKKQARGPVFDKAAKEVVATDKALEGLEGAINRVKDKAAEVPKAERTAELVSDENYAREQLAKMDPLLVNARYAAACGERKNWVLINAVHRAKAAGFPLVTDETMAKGRESLIASSELLPRIEVEQRTLGTSRSVTGQVKNELLKAATEAGVDWRQLLSRAKLA